jgi:hypothetical protein
MSNTNTGGPAFPNEGGPGNLWNEKGMTLRDYFAAKAMQGLLVATVTPITVWSQDDVAETAYNMADAMLKARQA